MATKPLADVSLRSATRADIPALAAFIKPFVDEGKILDRTADELEELIESFFIAERDGEIVGCAVLEIYSRKLAELRSLCVAPHMQGSGLGRMLVNMCLARAKEKNILEVMAITANDMFFKACGFDYTMTGEKRALFYKSEE